MTQSNKLNFIIVDDSPLDCFIAEKVVRNTGKAASIKSFLTAKSAINYVVSAPLNENEHTIIFVDIQMPVMNGFDFVEQFEALPMAITCRYSIFMVSSSINDTDLNRVGNYPSIKQFLNKPITSNNIAMLISNF